MIIKIAQSLSSFPRTGIFIALPAFHLLIFALCRLQINHLSKNSFFAESFFHPESSDKANLLLLWDRIEKQFLLQRVGRGDLWVRIRGGRQAPM